MNRRNTQRGQVIIINTLMFFALSVAIIFALTTPVVSSFNITSSFSKSKEAFLLANSATNEAFYKLNTGMNLSSSETVTLAQGSSTITVSNTLEGKNISVTSDVDSYQKKYELELITGGEIRFNYGLQVGQGGFDISGNSGIIGNVYSNGSIIGNNGAFITGSVVVASTSNRIDGMTIGEDEEGDAWAYEINDSSVEGTTYCQIGTGACNTSRGVPVEQSFPLSEEEVAQWKLEAESYGATTTQSFGAGTHYLGPIKINGDLSVGSGGTLNLEGIVYVTGNVLVNGNGVIRVNPALSGQGIILINDGVISANGGGQFAGSGASGSYILLITTSSCPDGGGCSNSNAAKVSGGTGAVVINAQNGTLEFNGGAQAKQATAKRIIMTGGSVVTYESSLINPEFTTGLGDAWTIYSWKEVE